MCRAAENLGKRLELAQCAQHAEFCWGVLVGEESGELACLLLLFTPRLPHGDEEELRRVEGIGFRVRVEGVGCRV